MWIAIEEEAVRACNCQIVVVIDEDKLDLA